MTTAIHTPSRACHMRGCPNPACALENYRYMARLRLDHARGQRRRTDATQTRVHIERLLAAGWIKTQIARAAKLNHHGILEVLAGQRTVANSTARAILSIPIGPAPDDTRDVDATGTIRRLRALVAIGWPIAQLAPRIGIHETPLGNISRGQLRQVRTATAEAVAAAYRDLSRIPGPSNRTRMLAAKKGWHSPLAWDDIDDPNCQPETAAPYKPADKYKRDNDRTHEIEHLYLLGESVPSIAKQLGGSEKYIGDQLNTILRKREERAERERAAKAGLEAAA